MKKLLSRRDWARKVGKTIGAASGAVMAGKMLSSKALADDSSDSVLSDEQLVVFITGTAWGFGRQTALQLIERGHRVYGADIDTENNAYLRDLGAVPLAMDVRSDAEVQAAVDQVIQAEGRIDVLINNAGYGTMGTIEDVPLPEVINQFDVNVFGYARVQKAVVPHMRRQGHGRIVVVSSVVGMVSTGFFGWYCASKHAVEGMADALRAELAPFNISVVKVQPGSAQTNFEATSFETLERLNSSEDYLDLQGKFVRTMRLIFDIGQQPESVARVIVKAALSRKPHSAYLAGLDAKLMALIDDLAPRKLFDKLYASITEIGGIVGPKQ